MLYAYKAATKDDVVDADMAAEEAQKERAKTSPAYKKEMIGKLSATIAEMKDEVISIMIEEGGSTLPKYMFE